MTVHVILLSGRSGVGKTSVANEMSAELRRHNISHAHIDSDNLDFIYPEEVGPDMMLSNLAALCGNYYRQRGCKKLILSGTAMVLEHEPIRETIQQIVRSPSEEEELILDGVILTAVDAVAQDRLQRREIGSLLDQHLDSSQKMSSILQEEVGDWARRISTDGKNVKDVAVCILKDVGWI
ncbi:hypothetical protein EYZ11_006797 [Aspergillus tanneri]|uniref:APS kinase domain-containing protein n=1 Tax=Aspergillus tanneri TaxID=1220188 RepID=A0A4S3JKA0_9EURO|nr:uncharacterized protein ATNIH1004_004248 [Aspergillus tanneri]KAA8648363.1 hypothetical protein ATNIH1004_004248 [Aspergillus tanneri]THC93721.1 hypothetical protein EYZ11_006797 [Aspergillus tanneri]